MEKKEKKEFMKMMFEWKKETLKYHLSPKEVKKYLKRDVKYGRNDNGESMLRVLIYKSKNETYEGIPIIFPIPDDFILSQLGEDCGDFLANIQMTA